MERYQAGDATAVEDLIRYLTPPLMRFFHAPWLTTPDVEDLFQDCWVRIHKARHTYRPPEPVVPWAFAIARHTKLDTYRKRRRTAAREVLAAEPPERAEAPAPNDRSDELDRLLESLPESQREVIVLLKVNGLSLEEAARATSSTVGSVKQKVHRAYEKLRVALGGRA